MQRVVKTAEYHALMCSLPISLTYGWFSDYIFQEDEAMVEQKG